MFGSLLYKKLLYHQLVCLMSMRTSLKSFKNLLLKPFKNILPFIYHEIPSAGNSTMKSRNFFGRRFL